MDYSFKIDGMFFEIVEATQEDTIAIRELYENVTVQSEVNISLTRGEDPYNSVLTENSNNKIIICKNTETKKVIASVVMCVNNMLVNGKIEKVVYINGLKIESKYRKKYFIYPRLLKYLSEEVIGKYKYGYMITDLKSSSVQNLFEKRNKRLNYLPICKPQCRNITFVFKPAKKDKLDLIRGKVEGLDKFYFKYGSKYNLFPYDSIRDVTDNDYIVWKKNDEILAACCITNQEKYKNFLLKSSSFLYKILTFLPMNLLGYPKMVKEGKYFKHMNISLIMFDDKLNIKDRGRFIKSASSYIKDYDMCMLSMSELDPSYKALEHVKGIKIRTVLNSTSYEESIDFTNKPIYTDISLI